MEKDSPQPQPCCKPEYPSETTNPEDLKTATKPEWMSKLHPSSPMGSLPPVCDAHAHLIDYKDEQEIDKVINKAKQTGVKLIVENATSWKTFKRVLSTASRHPDLVIPSIGYHPYYLGDLHPAWESE